MRSENRGRRGGPKSHRVSHQHGRVGDQYDEFEQISTDIWTGQQVPIWIVPEPDPGDGVVKCVANVVVGHAMSAGCRVYLHMTNIVLRKSSRSGSAAFVDSSLKDAHVWSREKRTARVPVDPAAAGAVTTSCGYAASATALTRSRVRSMSRWLRRSRRKPPSGYQILVKRLSPRSYDSVTSVPSAALPRNS